MIPSKDMRHEQKTMKLATRCTTVHMASATPFGEERFFGWAAGVCEKITENCVRRPGREQTQRATPRPRGTPNSDDFSDLRANRDGDTSAHLRGSGPGHDPDMHDTRTSNVHSSGGCGPLAASRCTKGHLIVVLTPSGVWVAGTAPPLSSNPRIAYLHRLPKSVGSSLSCIVCRDGGVSHLVLSLFRPI
jgi:hypothetical protein